MAPTRWGICGAGRISHDFVTAISLLPREDHQVFGIAAKEKARAEKFALQHNIPNSFGSYAELFKQDIDVVYVGTINSEHKPVVLEAINAGKSVICEKCLGVNHKEVKQMIAAARSKGVFLMEAYWSKFYPIWRELMTAVANDELGEIKFVSASFSNLFDQTRSARDPAFGGGHLTSIGCYPILLATALFKEYPEKIHASGILHENGGDMTASMQFVYKNGAVAHLSYYSSIITPRSAIVIGTKGTAYLPDFFWCPDKCEVNGVLRHVERPSEAGLMFFFPNSAGLSYEAEATRQCLLRGQKECPEMTLNESDLLMRIIDEVRRQIGVHYPQDEAN